jgi:limonene-1,2-epoxide hydrolase
VFNERVDRFWFKPGTFSSDRESWAQPCVGRWVVENGKIKLWRDYFDPAVMLRELNIGHEELQHALSVPDN